MIEYPTVDIAKAKRLARGLGHELYPGRWVRLGPWHWATTCRRCGANVAANAAGGAAGPAYGGAVSDRCPVVEREGV